MSKPFVLSALPGRFVLRRPVPAAILVLVLCGLAFAGIGKLRFDDGLVSFFRGDSAAFARYEDNRERFTPSQNAQAVLLTSDDFADAARLEAVREFTLELSFLDGVDAIHSAFSLANVTASGTSEPLFPFDLDGADRKDLADLLRQAHVHPLSQEMLVSEDRTAMLVVLQVDFDHRGLDGTRAVLDEVKSVAADVLAGQAIAFDVTGLGRDPPGADRQPLWRHDQTEPDRNDARVCDRPDCPPVRGSCLSDRPAVQPGADVVPGHHRRNRYTHRHGQQCHSGADPGPDHVGQLAPDIRIAPAVGPSWARDRRRLPTR